MKPGCLRFFYAYIRKYERWGLLNDELCWRCLREFSLLALFIFMRINIPVILFLPVNLALKLFRFRICAVYHRLPSRSLSFHRIMDSQLPLFTLLRITKMPLHDHSRICIWSRFIYREYQWVAVGMIVWLVLFARTFAVHTFTLWMWKKKHFIKKNKNWSGFLRR